MMSSAIPARLQFQCGHAALVSLPRIKGESAAQRNDRIAREKSSALSRECDFCAPALVSAVNGNGHHVAEQPEPAAVVGFVAESEPELVIVAQTEPIVSTPVEEFPVMAEVPAEEEALVDEDVPLEAVLLVEETPVLEEQTRTVEKIAVAQEVSEEIEAILAETPAPVRPVRRRVTRKPRAEEVARGRRFLVEYRVERVLRAVDIHDALRQASSLGAAELTAITREV